MTKIILTKEDKDFAISYSRKRMEFEYNRFGFNDQKRENMVLVGSLGQIAFRHLLDENGIIYEYQLQAGNYDDFDFKVNDDIIEIKASGFYGNYNKLNLLYSEDQFAAGRYKNFKYCVQIFIDGLNPVTRLVEICNVQYAYVVGYIDFENIIKYKHNKQHYGDDYKIPLTDLINIQDLVKTMKNTTN